MPFALSHEELWKHSERMTKIKRFIDKYDSEGINCPSEKENREKFEKNNLTIALNPLSANPEKWSNTLKQFVGNLPTNCLSVFDHFMNLALKGLKFCIPKKKKYILPTLQNNSKREKPVIIIFQ